MRYIVLLFLLFALNLSAEEKPSIARINITMNLDDVISIYGEPKESLTVLDWFNQEHIFNDFSIYTNGNEVVGVKALNEKACTHNMVCIGDKFGKLINKFGKPSNINRTHKSTKYIYAKPNSYCSYQFDVVGESVSKINIVCAPD